jgi:ribosomal protein S18 acetylase RimI-like enzyme
LPRSSALRLDAREAARMTRSLHDLADANLIEATREHARWQDPCECVEEGGVLMVAGANPLPIAFRNCVARVDASVPAREVLGRAREFFAKRGRGFVVLLQAKRDTDLDAAAVAAGLAPNGEIPCMLIDAPLAEPTIPAGVRVERFSEERHVHDAVQVVAEAYEALKLPAQEARLYFGRPSALLSPRVEGFVAYRDDRPVSTALTIMSGEGAGVYWVGTASEARRAGLGELCTRLATNAGFAKGARVVTLQASPFGEPIYRKLGYRSFDRLRRYRHPAP